MAVTQTGSPYSLNANWNTLYAQPSGPSPSMGGGAAPAQNYGFRMPGGSTATGFVGAPYVPPGVPDEMFQRLRNVTANPGSIEGDPAYQFIVDQGNKSLARSAGARRMRFAGKTMNEFQDFGQKAASQYWKTLADTYRAGAGTELDQWKAQMIQAEKEAEQRNMFMASPQYRLGQAQTYGDRPRSEIVASGGYASGRPSSPASYDQWRTARNTYNQFFPR
jgi:hypothetical protein